MSQVIYTVSKEDTDTALLEAESKYSDFSYGDVAPDEVRSLIDDVFERKNGKPHLAHLCQLLNECKTGKMVGGANAGIRLIIKRLNESKQPINVIGE